MLKGSCINGGLNEKCLHTEFQQLSEIERNALLAPKSKGKDQDRIPFVSTYNRLQTVKHNSHRHILQINSNPRNAFE